MLRNREWPVYFSTWSSATTTLTHIIVAQAGDLMNWKNCYTILAVHITIVEVAAFDFLKMGRKCASSIEYIKW